MTPVAWTQSAARDLEEILSFAAERSPRGAATIAARVRETVQTISTFPRAARRDPDTGAYEAVVGGVPLLVIYDLVVLIDGSVNAEIIAVFHTSRDPSAKPGRRT